MSFNVDAFREAHRPWTFTVGGHSWVARPVSAPAVAAFHAAFRAVQDDEETARAKAAGPAEWIRVFTHAERRRTAIITRLLRLAFPWRLSYRWRPSHDPVATLLSLEPKARNAAFASFFTCLEGSANPTPLPMTPGTPLSAPSGTR